MQLNSVNDSFSNFALENYFHTDVGIIVRDEVS